MFCEKTKLTGGGVYDYERQNIQYGELIGGGVYDYERQNIQRIRDGILGPQESGMGFLALNKAHVLALNTAHVLRLT